LLINAIEAFDLRSVQEVRERIGAGDGCTACHRELKRCIERRLRTLPVVQSASAASPI
jgi:bacterioferritin-associated ferredoxin